MKGLPLRDEGSTIVGGENRWWFIFPEKNGSRDAERGKTRAKMEERGSVVRWEMEVTITKPTADTKCVR